MGKLIFFLIIVGLIYILFKKKSSPQNLSENDNDLVQCDKCKTFYPKNEIYKINEKNICKDCYANS